MFSDRKMGKQTVMYTYNGIVFNNKNKWAIKPRVDIQEIQMHIAKEKKPI